MSNKVNIAYFIGEEGYGHATRSCGVITNTINIIGRENVHIDIFCGQHYDFLRQKLFLFTDIISIHMIDSNILLVKDNGHNLNHKKSISRAIRWLQSLEEWKSLTTKSVKKCSLVISDSVPQATCFAKYFSCPSINISHFTWDWMYGAISKVSELSNQSDIDLFGESLDIMTDMYDKFKLSIFPPLTPNENLELYRRRDRDYEYCSYILSDSFIETTYSHNNNSKESDYEKVLIMNNGTKSLTSLINNFIKEWPTKGRTNLVVGFSELDITSRKIIDTNPQISLLPSIEATHRYIGKADIIVARAGYNTLSELMHSNTSAILVDENNNPEIASNLEFAKIESYSISKPDSISVEMVKQALKTKKTIDSQLKCNLGVKRDLFLGRKQCAEIISGFLEDSTK